VKNVGRLVLILFGAISALAVILVIGANLYVQSQGTQARIQQELSQRLGTTLRIRRISVTPWWGLKLSGITIPQTDPAISGDFVEAKTFRLRIRFTSLFSKKLLIKEISLIDPTVVWAQNGDGKWRIPSSPEKSIAKKGRGHEKNIPPAPVVPTASASTASSETSEQSSPIRSEEPEFAKEEENEKAAPVVSEIQKVNVTGGNFRFVDVTGKIVARFEGVDFHSSLRRSAVLRGTAEIAKTSLRDRFFLEKLQSPVQYTPATLDFSKISARAAGGPVLGQFRMRPEEADSPFTVNVTFRDVQADRIVSDAGGPIGVVQGRLEGRFDAGGKTADANALSGTGEIFLRDGQVQHYSLLVALGQLLQIDELAHLHLDQAQVKYHLSPGLVTVDELLLRSTNIRLIAHGTITFAGKLHLDSQLAVNDKIKGQLFRAIRENFQPTEDPDFAAVNFQVGGTVERPKTNLMDKLVGRDLKDLGSAIKSFLGGGDKSERSKKKKPTGEVTPETTATPEEQTLASPAPRETAAPSATVSP
jgi:AsmA-like C-terminal region/AsmA family